MEDIVGRRPEVLDLASVVFYSLAKFSINVKHKKSEQINVNQPHGFSGGSAVKTLPAMQEKQF